MALLSGGMRMPLTPNIFPTQGIAFSNGLFTASQWDRDGGALVRSGDISSGIPRSNTRRQLPPFRDELAYPRQVRHLRLRPRHLDQGVWLLSRFRDSFVTIRGLPLFGDHASWECMPYLLARLPGIDTTNYSARRSWAPLSL